MVGSSLLCARDMNQEAPATAECSWTGRPPVQDPAPHNLALPLVERGEQPLDGVLHRQAVQRVVRPGRVPSPRAASSAFGGRRGVRSHTLADPHQQAGRVGDLATRVHAADKAHVDFRAEIVHGVARHLGGDGCTDERPVAEQHHRHAAARGLLPRRLLSVAEVRARLMSAASSSGMSSSWDAGCVDMAAPS